MVRCARHHSDRSRGTSTEVGCVPQLWVQSPLSTVDHPAPTPRHASERVVGRRARSDLARGHVYAHAPSHINHVNAVRCGCDVVSTAWRPADFLDEPTRLCLHFHLAYNTITRPTMSPVPTNTHTHTHTHESCELHAARSRTISACPRTGLVHWLRATTQCRVLHPCRRCPVQEGNGHLGQTAARCKVTTTACAGHGSSG